ncbi:hypothetical protein OHB04_02630 [Streptomyces sp. NBC_01775]|uniref:hypothetical protein n=1 Tax=Streptomyces sp. NBC_01775 TaxID=2975939 RepID=UPI002DDAFD0F|nr:hypothetical protein [Streptomyces sp. NBC_01775]WSB74789.1 hypothetical protein OHB04_02630 [Streptomyces sp. NBC_01775]
MAAHRLAPRARLRNRRRLERENDQLVCQLVAAATDINTLTRQLDEAAIDLSGAREDRRYAEATVATLTEQLAAEIAENHQLRAKLATAGSVDVAAWVRPIDGPADEATAPIPAGDHWADTGRWRAA